VGYSLQSKQQKEELSNVCKEMGKNIDYVAAWYYKAAQLMQGTTIKAALVSTNSITQGEQVAAIWKPLKELFDIEINFAYQTFRWDSEASLKAHVHCVIIGFGYSEPTKRVIFEGEKEILAENINAYLVDAEDVFIDSRSKAICDVPTIGIGNKPIDGGNYLFSKEEMEEFIQQEPSSAQYFRPWYGATEFINRKPRYCLWLGECSPAELRKMPLCLKRIEAVRDFRLSSRSAGTIKLAERPTRFHVENMPNGTYIIVPRHSSEIRRYIPIGFLDSTDFCGDANLMIPDANLYHLGIIISNVHMAWVRAVCGRLEMRYRYSKDIVYNNFPWPTPTDQQKAKIEQTAQAILDARALYPEASLADLYDEVTMPPELRKAHQANDKAVMQAYGFPVKDFTESDCVAELFKMYNDYVKR
jgi:hypothetical protein